MPGIDMIGSKYSGQYPMTLNELVEIETGVGEGGCILPWPLFSVVFRRQLVF